MTAPRMTVAGRMSLAWMLVAAAAGTLLIASAETVTAQQNGRNSRTGAESIPAETGRSAFGLPVKLDGLVTLRGTVTVQGGGNGGGIAGDACSPVQRTYSSSTFAQGDNLTLQAGFVDDEIAAVTYEVPPDHLPLRVDLMEMLFATNGSGNSQPPFSGSASTAWSILVWEGLPTTGTLVAEYEADGAVLPFLQASAPGQGIIAQVTVDPNDPDQIIIGPNSANAFTIGFRIDEHNQPSSNPCFVGPPTCCNIFPTTDRENHPSSSLDEPTRNWLFGIDCDEFGCPPNGGWARFSQLSSGCRPSGDWNMRATYTPLSCVPRGACCITGVCTPDLTEAECNAQSGVYRGDNSACSASTCRGACCVPSSQSCVNFNEVQCAQASGTFSGIGTSCATTICFPVGACCLPDGGCLSGQTPTQCTNAGGIFQGHETTCAAANCPIPMGACCLSGGGCVDDTTEDDCETISGTWSGEGSTCMGGACSPSCPADVNDNGTVDVNDLLLLIGAWGPCSGCDADLNDNGTVDVNDLLLLIGAWGPC